MSPLESEVEVNEVTGQQTITRDVDIPDANLKPAPTVVLAPEIVEEMLIRTYLRKDGVVIKDVRGVFAVVTGTARDGTEITKIPISAAQADELVSEACVKSGRKMGVDFTTGRPKATPGWRLELHVPGHAHEEQNAPKKNQSEDRLKIAEKAVVQLQTANQELVDLVKDLGQQVQSLLPKQPTKPLDKMNHAELDRYAALNDISYRVSEGELTKSEKVYDIEEALEIQAE